MREIETDRLLLRGFRMDDLDELSVIYGDPDVVRYMGSGKPVQRAETEHALRSIIRHCDQHGFGRWAAIHKATRRLIGYGGLRWFNDTPELVYLLAKPYWGLGLATEIARASLDYGFHERSFERVIAMAMAGNKASHRVLQKIGMRFEKRANIYEMEVVCYAISRAEHSSMRVSDGRAQPGYSARTEAVGG